MAGWSVSFPLPQRCASIFSSHRGTGAVYHIACVSNQTKPTQSKRSQLVTSLTDRPWENLLQVGETMDTCNCRPCFGRSKTLECDLRSEGGCERSFVVSARHEKKRHAKASDDARGVFRSTCLWASVRNRCRACRVKKGSAGCRWYVGVSGWQPSSRLQRTWPQMRSALRKASTRPGFVLTRRWKSWSPIKGPNSRVCSSRRSRG